MSIQGAGGSSSSILYGPTMYDGVPVTLLGDTNDLEVNPDNFSLIALRPLITCNLTGLKHAQNSRVAVIANVGTVNVTLVNASGSSQQQNRFSLNGVNVVLAPGNIITLICLSQAQGWVILSASLAGSSSGGAATLGTYLEYTAAAGETDNVDPVGFGPTIGRLDVDTTAGDANFTGLEAGADGQIVIISNIGANVLTLNALNSSSLAANQFRAPADFSLLNNGSIFAAYYAGTINKWVLSP